MALTFRLTAAALVATLAAPLSAQLIDVTQPGDPIVPTSNMSPGPDGVANAIDDQPTKYLNFDKLNTGFTVTPRAGASVVVGLRLTSANDHPERDPASYALSGSNDGMNFIPISSGPVPPFPIRFHMQEFLFPEHTNSYTSYRLTFPTVADPAAANSMQIAEVELLHQKPPIGRCFETNSLIRKQPVDTPVLAGMTATFRVEPTGPWHLQWYRNDAEIPGATSYTYVTPPATMADDGSRYRARLVGPDCYEDSVEVMLSIFRPSEIESIGLNFLGHDSASGPVEMFPHDITGLHPQAYWTNLPRSFTTNVGSITHPLTSSNRAHPTITVYWATSRAWGVSLGDETPAIRMLDGMTTTDATNETTAHSVTFSNVPPGSHSLIVYTVQRPTEFFSMDLQTLTFDPDGAVATSQRRFIRPENSDEYRRSPGFHLVTSDTPAARSVGNTIRFDHLQAGDGRIQLRFFSPDHFQRPPPAEPVYGPGINGVQLLLNPFGVQTRITNFAHSGTSVSFSYATIRGFTYTVEYTDALGASANWAPLLPRVIGTGSLVNALDSAPNPRMRFYRVRLE